MGAEKADFLQREISEKRAFTVKLQEMLKLGCSGQMKITSAFHTYMKLCEVDRLWDVQFFYNEQLDIIYLTSSDKKQKLLHIPVTVQHQMSPMWIHSVTTALKEKHPDAEVNIVLKTPDSSLLTYKLHEGLCSPPTPDSTKEKKALKEKIQYIQSELNKRKPELYEEAKRKLLDPSDKCDNDEEVKMEEAFSGEL